MTDKFVSPCPQPEGGEVMTSAVEKMAKVFHDKEIEWIGLEVGEEALIAAQWENLSNGAKAAKVECMTIALEALKNPPEEFLQAMANRVYGKLNMCSQTEIMHGALIAAIEQTLEKG